jgi:hypothetical protein
VPGDAEETMTRDELARIKKALTGAVGKRLDRANALAAPEVERLRNVDSRRAAAKLVAPIVDRATRRQFAELLAADRAKLDTAAKAARANAIRNSRANQRVLAAAAAQRLKPFETAAGLGTPEYELLNTPFLIWPTNSVDLEASEIIPANSFAKFRASVDDGKGFRGDVKFHYLWTNPRNKFALINVDGYVIFNGHIFVGVGGGNFPGDRSASAEVTGTLQILEWFNQPPTSPPQQVDQTATAAKLRVSAPGFFEVGAIDAKDVFRGFDLRHTMFTVPPLATIVFVVVAGVALGTGQDSGNADADFASGSFQVGSPAVLVTTIS